MQPRSGADSQVKPDAHLPAGLDAVIHDAVNLSAGDSHTRLLAASELTLIRSYLFQQLYRQAGEPGFWSNHAEDGSTVLTLRLIGDWRLSDFAPDLLDHIDFEINASSRRAGEKTTPVRSYPAAVALASISGSATNDNLIWRLSQDASDRQRRLCVWVLLQSEGPA